MDMYRQRRAVVHWESKTVLFHDTILFCEDLEDNLHLEHTGTSNAAILTTYRGTTSVQFNAIGGI